MSEQSSFEGWQAWIGQARTLQHLLIATGIEVASAAFWKAGATVYALK